MTQSGHRAPLPGIQFYRYDGSSSASGATMRRREFITLLSCMTVIRPIAAWAQQPTTPVIGYLDSRSPEAVENRLGGFRRGLKEVGYIEGENITIIHRWAEDQADRLPLLAADLVSRSVAAIVTA